MTPNTQPNLLSPDLPAIGIEKMAETQQPDVAWTWPAMIACIDRFSTACDCYIDMMTKHNTYLLMTLEQLVRDTTELLTTLNQVCNKQQALPPLLLPNKRLGILSLPLSQTPNLSQNRAHTCLLHPQHPCAVPCPLHHQAPYKIHTSAPSSTYLPSRLIPTTTRQTKDNYHPP